MSTPLLVARDIEKSFGDRRVLRGCELTVAPGERVGLVGVNGCGKSTLLHILAGVVEADLGEVTRPASVALLRQEPLLPGATVGEAAAEALSWHRALLSDYEDALHTGDLERSADLQAQIDHHGWTVDHRMESILGRLGAPPADAPIEQLSGGERRRVALARALLRQPDLLLLDEPTNHLDAETVDWLQSHLESWSGGAVLVTHDRYLLEAVATRIVEVEDGLCVSYPGSYGDYLVLRAERQALLHRTEDVRLAYIAREAEWAARSPAARTSKSRSRLQRLDALSKVRPIRREETFELDLSTGNKTGRTIVDMRGIDHGYDGNKLLDGFDFSLAAGERVGVLGPNGAGKSTLLRLLAGTEAPNAGEVMRGGRVRVAVLDQHRTGLSTEDTVMEAAAGGSTHVTLGDRNVHVAGFLRRFLFTREMLDQPVAKLSGGERARLLLARLLLQGANLLLLDEPTNDLDLMTLRVLEEALMSFDGSAVVVTHDRAFLDRVCTSVLGFVGDGTVLRYGSRQQVARDLAARKSAGGADAKAEQSTRRSEAAQARRSERAAKRPRKLTHAQRREYDELPARIEALEQETATLEGRLADPATYIDGGGGVAELTARLGAIGPEAEALFERWAELDELA